MKIISACDPFTSMTEFQGGCNTYKIRVPGAAGVRALSCVLFLFSGEFNLSLPHTHYQSGTLLSMLYLFENNTK